MKGLIIGEGDRVMDVTVHSNLEGYCLKLYVRKLDGARSLQVFHGDATMLNLDLSLMKGQFIKSVALVDCTDLRITFSKEFGIQGPLLIK